ncbi:hypothetical protein BpsS36_00065 [Bacillus phage vB_BpsS-36]|uniref:Uncharacterized protein n=1 Tax=Bacillus phage vB_BpsS-36 TaxID=2419622 RepID=A0A3G3BXW2_9CAUD|nr:hypothetical protein BpsS36_00065 [Bacillus phage vB_BpsS-36]
MVKSVTISRMELRDNMEWFKVYVHEITNEELYKKDIEVDHFDDWDKMYTVKVPAESIEKALEVVAGGLTASQRPWRVISHNELTGVNERGQKCYRSHSKNNTEYMEKLEKDMY